ncbi:MAG: PorV/PorQ family protein [Gemmatimonas sp.]
MLVTKHAALRHGGTFTAPAVKPQRVLRLWSQRTRPRLAGGRASCRLARAATMVSLAYISFASRAHAQKDNYAPLFLLQPAGARTVGHGEAATADTAMGTEGLWWNPASMARMRKREFAIHHAQAFSPQSGDILSFAYPSKALGTVAASFMLVNYGDGLRTDSVGNTTGDLTNRYYVLSAGYATPIGSRFSFGITGKRIMMRFLCSGECGNYPNRIGNTSALDFGAQFRAPVKFPLVFGASVRNLGPNLQAKDEAQADPIPRVIQVGAQAQVPIEALAKNDAALDVRGDVLTSPALNSPSFRAGADLTYKGLYAIRVGYKRMGALDGLEGGLTAGFGLRYNSMQLDVARRFDSSANLGESSSPTYVTLRFVF